MINNIKSYKKDRSYNHERNRSGFTIVELLVVIVVIGILAAITIVSYTGITSRASTQANKSNANSALSAAQIVYANTGSWPLASATNALPALNASDAKIPGGLVVSNAILAAGTTIRYIVNVAGTGVCVGYWDYTGSGSAQFLYGGVATADSNAAAGVCTP